jgi:hypothetical protein
MTAYQQRIWLITGASSGFGRAIAEAALAAGDTVVAAARRPDAVSDLVESTRDRVTPLQLDVTDPDRIAAAVAEVLDRHGRIDVLVNNAGRGVIGAVEETTNDELRDLMHLHFFGPAALTRGAPSYAGTWLRCHRPDEQHGRQVHLPRRRGLLRDEVRPRRMVGSPGQRGRPIRHPGVDRRTRRVQDLLQRVRCAADLRGDRRLRRADRPVRKGMAEDDGSQPGDPAKAAEAILQAVDSPEPPLRLALGNDAVDSISNALDEAKAELAAWERVGRATVFD